MKQTPHAFTDIAIKDNVSFNLQIIELEFCIKFQIFVSFYAFLIFRSTDFRDGDIFCKLHSFECKIFVRKIECVLFEGVLFLLLWRLLSVHAEICYWI